MNPSTVASVIIPAFNRIGPLRNTVASARAACLRLAAGTEIILVDDGSTPPLADAVPEFAIDPMIRIIRQPNQGSIIARLTGLAAAVGEFILFLDSDDLVSTEKLQCHCTALAADPALAVSYDDVGALTDPSDTSSTIHHIERYGPADDLADLLLRVQPAPHGCISRRAYLLRALAKPVVVPERSLDPAGDVWLYYNLSVHLAQFAKIDAALTFTGIHEEARYSQSWEQLGTAALRLAERFIIGTAHSSDIAVLRAREVAGECAFRSWRRLPRDFSPEFTRRLLAIWRAAPHGPRRRLGGPLFCMLAILFGSIGAGRLLRQRNALYATCRTVDDDTVVRLLSA